MALILNIETSTSVCSVCLAKDGNLIDYREDLSGNSHARVLTVFIDKLFKSNQLHLSDLQAVAVSAGPGSYTGLRIGTSVAKGLCYALNKPLIAVPTLQALAFAIRQQANIQDGDCYLPVLDARRMDAYTAVYDKDLNLLRPVTCATLDEAFEQSLETLGRIYIGGNAMEKCKKLFSLRSITYVQNVLCDSRSMISLANQKYLHSEFENTAYFEPFYFKEFSGKSGPAMG